MIELFYYNSFRITSAIWHYWIIELLTLSIIKFYPLSDNHNFVISLQLSRNNLILHYFKKYIE